MACAPSEDSDQPGPPPSLIRVFAVRINKAWVLSYPLRAQWSLWSDWADAQVDLSLHWAHMHFVGFVMWRLKYLVLLSTYRITHRSSSIHRWVPKAILNLIRTFVTYELSTVGEVQMWFGCCCLFGFNVAFNNFQSYPDGVWMRQGSQCSLL